jgi:hypothetical protein
VPNRVFDRSKLWKLIPSDQSDYFKKEEGQGTDQIDELKEKYYKSTMRGLGSVENFLNSTKRS